MNASGRATPTDGALPWTRSLVDTVYDVEFNQLPTASIDVAKRVLIDSVACTIGGADSAPARAVHAVVSAAGAAAEATVIGSGLQTSTDHAALANGTMLRYLDFMDTLLYEGTDGAVSATHPSELLPAIIAEAQASRRSGRELLLSVVVTYELAARWCRAMREYPLRDAGWHHSSIGAHILPVVLARLAGATREQAAAAMGLAGMRNYVLNIIDADEEEPNAARHVAFPLVAADCLRCVRLARAGLHGPARIVEGQHGFLDVLGSDAWRVDDVLRMDYGGIQDVWMKPHVACVLGQAALTALFEVLAAATIDASDVTRIVITTSPAARGHMGGELRRSPTTKETADHSLYYLAAAAVRWGAVGPAQFAPERYRDPLLAEVASRVELAELADGSAAARALVETRDGGRFERTVELPRGHPRRPLSSADLDRKLRACSADRLAETSLDQFVTAIERLESEADVANVMPFLTFGS